VKEFAWAIVNPDGEITADSRWLTADDAWRGEGDIPRDMSMAELRALGWRVLRVRLFEVGPAGGQERV
jgi:hypothetical protein